MNCRPNCTAPECAIDVLLGYFDMEIAIHLLWEETCFPMDCRAAAAQAQWLIDDDLGRLMAL